MNNLAPAEMHECPKCESMTFAEDCCLYCQPPKAPLWTINVRGEVKPVPFTLWRSNNPAFHPDEITAHKVAINRLFERGNEISTKIAEHSLRVQELEK